VLLFSTACPAWKFFLAVALVQFSWELELGVLILVVDGGIHKEDDQDESECIYSLVVLLRQTFQTFSCLILTG